MLCCMCLANAVIPVLMGTTKKSGQSELKEYRYMYKAYPFDIRRYFKISAGSREEADKLASVKYKKMFDEKQTITEELYPANE